MAGMTYWNGTAEVPVTLTRWNGTSEVAVSPYRWDGATETPCFSAPPATGFIAASTTTNTGSPGTSQPLTVPAGTLATDLVIAAVTFANSAATISDTAGFTARQAVTIFGTAASWLGTRTGLVGGDTVTIVGTNLGTARWALLTYRGYNYGATATPTSRGASSTALTAPNATGTGLHVVVGWEKSGGNAATGAPAPTVSGAAVNERAWVPWQSNATGMPSLYLADYTGTPSSRTLAYPIASANGRGTQIRLDAA